MLTSLAKTLRRNATKEERLLWKRLCLRQAGGYKFNRQRPIGKYIVDFACLEKGLIIEIDGFQHGFEENAKRDQKRDAWLASEGFVTLRFTNRDINRNLDGVLRTIWSVLRD